MTAHPQKISEKEKKRLEKIRKQQMKLVNQFRDYVLKKYKNVVKAIILFGSLVRGDFHSKSDID